MSELLLVAMLLPELNLGDLFEPELLLLERVPELPPATLSEICPELTQVWDWPRRFRFR